MKNTSNRNNESWNALVEYLPRYLRQCFGLTLNKEDIDDITQQTVQGILSKLEKIETVKYIETVAYNFALDMIGRRKRDKEKFMPLEVCVEAFNDNEEGTHSAKPLHAYYVEESLVKQSNIDAKDRITEISMRLPKVYRIFLANYSSFLAQSSWSRTERQDFARAYGCTETKVNVTFHRIRKHLKALNVSRH